MEFSRMGQHTIRCLVSEAEISDMGYTMEELMSNGSRTQEFMNRIFDMAERQFEMKFESGVKTVRADFLPNHSLCLTFSTHPAEGILEHLKDLVGDLMEGKLPEDLLEEEEESEKPAVPKTLEKKPRSLKPEAKENESKGPSIIVLLVFESLDTAAAFAGQVREEDLVDSSLYKYADEYFLSLDLTPCSEEQVTRLSLLTDEFTRDIVPGASAKAFMEEHGKAILKKKAMETLREL